MLGIRVYVEHCVCCRSFLLLFIVRLLCVHSVCIVLVLMFVMLLFVGVALRVF